jgi:Mg2+-importing ATPase
MKSTKEVLVTRTDYWSLQPDEVYKALNTSKDGLTQGEASARLETAGYNELPRQGFSALGVLVRQFGNPLFIILLVATIVSFFVGSPDQAITILIIIALSVVLGFYNEYKAGKLIDELQRKVSIKAVVTRDGKVSEIEARLLVPGDVVTVYIGDIVPADMRIVEVKDIEVDEATLTGESFPVVKTSQGITVDHPTAHSAGNYLFTGTVIVHGSAKGVVTKTGKETEFGYISKSLARPHPQTEFQRGVKQYGNLLIGLTMALAVAIFVLNAALNHPLLQSLLFALAVAIGLVPELMPVIVTICLSNGANNMAKQRVIVKRLVSMEDFGNMDVLCTDKTGTLTEGKIILKNYFSLDTESDPRTLLYALLSSPALLGEKITGNPMDVAVWEFAIARGMGDVTKPYTKVDEMPFDYQRRMVSTVVKDDGNITLVTKGAPESVIAQCGYYDSSGTSLPINDDVIAAANKRFQEYSESGYRLLAIAYRKMEAKEAYSVKDEVALTLLGFLVFTDPPKPDAQAAIKRLEELGVQTKILTGDNPLVARKICQDLNLPVRRVLDGPELTHMSWSDFKAAVEEADIFARVTPEQKLEVIKALKENHHVVGYMGDGVNDAPALYEADASISVDSAVDVSKDAADIVLLEKDLMVLAQGIDQGRKTFGNTIKYVLMGTSSNFGNMFSAAAASIFLPFLPMLPMQILFMNLLYDISNLTLPSDIVDDEDTRWPRHWDISFIRKFTLFFGPFSSLYDFLTFGIMLFIFKASTPAQASLFQSGWFVESFWTEVLVIFVIRTRRIPFVRSKPGKWLTIFTISAVAFGTILPFTFLGSFLGFTALPPNYWLLLILMVATYLLLVDAGKVFFYKVCGF